ncbi:MAG: cation-binding protein [Candidatus Lokiarchaeota archaeon]|nr:cation-binding protein [Candidatus Lokiarchaeota archaeon]
MLPIAPLMIEHRLIERMIHIFKLELDTIKEEDQVDPNMIYKVVDFIRTYADETHHGKEEDILFRELKKKELSPEHQKTMNELINEHVYARKTTSQLVDANELYEKGNKDSLNVIIKKIEELIEFYPKHIEKEDKHFFTPIMEYFNEKEQQELLKEGQAFDRKMIHRKYQKIVKKYETQYDISPDMKDSDWINYL